MINDQAKALSSVIASSLGVFCKKTCIKKGMDDTQKKEILTHFSAAPDILENNLIIYRIFSPEFYQKNALISPPPSLPPRTALNRHFAKPPIFH